MAALFRHILSVCLNTSPGLMACLAAWIILLNLCISGMFEFFLVVQMVYFFKCSVQFPVLHVVVSSLVLIV